MKSSSFLLLLLLVFLHSASAQKSDSIPKNKTYGGFTFGINTYTPTTMDKNIPVKRELKPNDRSFEGGLSLIFETNRNLVIKSGLEYTYYRSPFYNDTSFYESQLSLPLLFSILNKPLNNEDQRFVWNIGPRFCFPLKQGMATKEDENYDEFNSVRYFKFAASSEMAMFLYKGAILHSFGLRATIDISQMTFNSNRDFEPQLYLSCGFFYSITFSRK